MRCAPSGPQPALGQEGAQAVVGGRQPRHGVGEPVGDQGVGPRLEQPGAVAGAALVRVDGQVGELAGGDRVAVGVGGRSGHHEAGDQVALERDQHPVAGVVGPAEREAPALGDLRRRRGRRGPRRAAGRRTSSARRAPARRRSRGRRRPRRPGRRRQRWSWAPSNHRRSAGLAVGQRCESGCSRCSSRASAPQSTSAASGAHERSPTTATGHHPARTLSPKTRRRRRRRDDASAAAPAARGGGDRAAPQRDGVQPEPEQPVEPDA